MPHVEAYDSSRDPLDHLESFETLMHLQGVLYEIICRAFPTTLKGPVRVWFSKLAPQYHLHFQGTEWAFRHPLYQRPEVQEVLGEPVEHQTIRR